MAVEEGNEKHVVQEIQKECPACGWETAVISAVEKEDGVELRLDTVDFCPYCGFDF